MMDEELLVYAILFHEEMVVSEELYLKKLDSLFLENPEDESLLTLEWETDMKQAMVYIRAQFDYRHLNHEKFGRILMGRLREYYDDCRDIRYFAGKMYSLWECLPGCVQEEEPFWTLCYADDPLSWGDEGQTRFLYEKMLAFYRD